jgi:plasmid maintenance system antidote protein VapI
MTEFEERFVRLTQTFDMLLAECKILNKRDMAKQMGVTVSHLFSRLAGSTDITEDFCAKMQLTFGISKKWLLTGEGNMSVAQLQGADTSPELRKLLEEMSGDIRRLNERVMKLEKEVRGFTDTRKN